MERKLCEWWRKDHRPRSLSEEGPHSVGGSHSNGLANAPWRQWACGQKNLKRTLEKAGQEDAKSGKRPARESTLDELEAAALEGTCYDVKEEPEEEPPSLFK